MVSDSGTFKIFLSCVSDDFPEHREDLRRSLKQTDVDIHIQDDDLTFKEGKLLEAIDRYIQDHSHVVVHLAGRKTGLQITPAEQEWLKQKYPDFGQRFPFPAEDL